MTKVWRNNDVRFAWSDRASLATVAAAADAAVPAPTFDTDSTVAKILERPCDFYVGFGIPYVHVVEYKDVIFNDGNLVDSEWSEKSIGFTTCSGAEGKTYAATIILAVFFFTFIILFCIMFLSSSEYFIYKISDCVCAIEIHFKIIQYRMCHEVL